MHFINIGPTYRVTSYGPQNWEISVMGRLSRQQEPPKYAVFCSSKYIVAREIDRAMIKHLRVHVVS